MIEKIRHKLIKLENMVLAAVMLLLLCSQLYAQEPESRRARRNAREKSEVQNADFVRAAFDTRDTLIAAHDSLHRADSISGKTSS